MNDQEEEGAEPVAPPAQADAPAAAPAPATAPAPAAAAPPVAPSVSIDLTNPDVDRNPNQVAKELSQATSGGGSQPPDTTAQPNEQPYNPEINRDGTRQAVTFWLIGIFCAIVVMAFAALFAYGIANGFGTADFLKELKTMLDVLVGPVITLLSSAIGFYFGFQKGAAAKS